MRALLTPLFGVVVMFAGLGFLLAPAPAGAAPPAQGWTTTEAPLPADAGSGSTNPDVYIASAACPALNGCVQVGWYSDTGGHPWGLIETQNGTSWSDTEAPQPSNAGSGTNQSLWIGNRDCGFILPCHAVSCPSVSFCVAVGQYEDNVGTGHFQPLIETRVDGTWSAAQAALPGDTATDAGPTNFPNAFLDSVSCASSTSCVAVGQYKNASGDNIGLVDTLSGSTWTGVAAPLPSNASVPPNSGLFGVSCASASSCVVAGAFNDTLDKSHGLLLNLANGTWTATDAPEPANAGNDIDGFQSALLTQVTCASATACQAVGFYADSSDNSRPLIDSWDGSSWSATEGPEPADAGAGFTQLAAVACPTPTWCTAVGTYADSSGKNWGLIDTLAGGTWTATKSPQPANAQPESNQFTYLADLACPTVQFCMSTGYYEGPSNATRGYVATLVGGTWSDIEAPVPSNATLSASNYSWARTVACYSSVACTVGGFYFDPALHKQGYLDTWTGAQGYWLDASDGGIFTYPNNAFYGSTGALKLNKPMVGMAATPDAQGYWLVASDGGIFSYGDALFHGSRGGQHLNMPIVGMAATPTGNGYWLVASDGGIFSYGDAQFYGSTGSIKLNKPVVGMASTPDGKGYWLVASDGGIFSYGDATFYGSTGNLVLNKPVVGMAARPTGLGYWLVASDGGVFSYGDATFYGSTGSIVLNKPVVGMASSPSGKGYWFVASDGGVFSYGDAPFQGSAGALHLNAPVVGMAAG